MGFFSNIFARKSQNRASLKGQAYNSTVASVPPIQGRHHNSLLDSLSDIARNIPSRWKWTKRIGSAAASSQKTQPSPIINGITRSSRATSHGPPIQRPVSLPPNNSSKPSQQPLIPPALPLTKHPKLQFSMECSRATNTRSRTTTARTVNPHASSSRELNGFSA
jgi:hypothetical protein